MPSPQTQGAECPKCRTANESPSPFCTCAGCGYSWSLDWEARPGSFRSRNSSKKALRAISRLSKATGHDSRALHILISSQWDLDGKRWLEGGALPPEDLAYARDHGLMAPPQEFSHQELVAAVVDARGQVDPAGAADCFVLGLHDKRQDQRSAISSLARSLHLEPHDFADEGFDHCATCGFRRRGPVDFGHYSFRKVMWAGNVCCGSLPYILWDLRSFEPAAGSPPPDARRRITDVLDALRALPSSAGLGDLLQAVSKLIPGNKQERQVVLEILGDVGILRPRDLPSFHSQYLPFSRLPTPDHFYSREWRSPVSCWTGADGVDEDAVQFWFGHLL